MRVAEPQHANNRRSAPWEGPVPAEPELSPGPGALTGCEEAVATLMVRTLQKDAGALGQQLTWNWVLPAALGERGRAFASGASEESSGPADT